MTLVSSQNPIPFNDTHLPRLFQVSDDLADRAQGKYLSSIRLHIISLLGASLTQMALSLLGYLQEKHFLIAPPFTDKILNMLLGAFVLMILLTRFILRQRHWEKIWYHSRTTAEQIRRLTWQYMMGLNLAGDPDAADPPAARRAFLAEITALDSQWTSRVGASANLADARLQTSEISHFMDARRNESPAERQRFYRDQRLQEQAVWFDAKAKINDRRARQFARFQITAEALAALVAVLFAVEYLGFRWSALMWPLLTIAASVLAWIGYRRYAELADSYTQTAEQLHHLLEDLKLCTEVVEADVQFAHLVRKTEGLLAWENSLWITRRGF